MELHRQDATHFVVLDARQGDVFELAGGDLSEVLLLGPDQAPPNQRVVRQAPRWRHMVVLRKELSKADNRATGPHLRLESIDQRAHGLDQLAFALPEGHLLILDVVNLILILLDKFLVPLREDSQCSLLLALGLSGIAIHLGLDEAILNLLKLGFEAREHALHGLLLLLKSSWCREYRKFFLLDLKSELVTHLAQLFFEVYLVAHCLLWLICQQGELLRQQ